MQDPGLKIVSPKRSERTENTTLPYQMRCKKKKLKMSPWFTSKHWQECKVEYLEIL